MGVLRLRVRLVLTIRRGRCAANNSSMRAGEVNDLVDAHERQVQPQPGIDLLALTVLNAINWIPVWMCPVAR